MHRTIEAWPRWLCLLAVWLFITSSSSHAIINETSSTISAATERLRSLVDNDDSHPPPVIGILSQPDRTDRYHYIVKAYVDWVEDSGARAIPIPYDATPELLDDLFTQINGVLLPGGWNGYMPPSVPYLLDKIVESNNEGRYFPVWGICLGYEFLIKYIGGESAIQDGFYLYNTSIPLESVRIGQLYADPTIYSTVVTKPVTLNNHKLGIEPGHFLGNEKLTKVWNITSINHDSNGRPFVSTIEPMDPNRFPLYGVQYHPEKNGFEFTTYPGTSIPYEAIDHSEEGVAFSIHLSRFFVNLVRRGQKSNHQHSYTKPDVYPAIEDYPLQTGLKQERVYVIPDASHWAVMMDYYSSSPTSLVHNSDIVAPLAKPTFASQDARAYLQLLVSTSAV
jgi:gamma-glutamyl hydrolase